MRSSILGMRAKGVAVQLVYVRDGVIRASVGQGVEGDQGKQDAELQFRGWKEL